LPAFYSDDGAIKVRQDIAGLLHQNSTIFITECAAILRHYQGGVHLDIGCGNRKITEKAIGVDVEDIVDIYRGLINVVIPAAHLYCFADDSIDFISSIHSFEHFHDPDSVLREWYRVLKVGGRIGLVLPDKRGAIGNRLPGHAHDFGSEDLTSLVDRFRGGLRILEFDTLRNGWSINLVLEKHG
jgi:SAM-dependent methyltransferase